MKHLACIKKESSPHPLRDILAWPLDRLENVVKAARTVKTIYNLDEKSTILDIVMAATNGNNDVSALARTVNAWGDGKSGFESCKTAEASTPQKMEDAPSIGDFKKAVSEYPESVDIQQVIEVFLALKPDDMEEVVNAPDGTYPKAIEDAIYDEFEKIIGVDA